MIPMPPTPDGNPLGQHLIGSGLSSEVYPEDAHRVLKLFVRGTFPEAVANEFHASRRAWDLGLPVPHPLAQVEREGRRGILFERVDGPSLFDAHRAHNLTLLLGLWRLARLHRRIHLRPGGDLPSQHAQLAREIGRSRVSERIRRAALARLDRLPRGSVLCHGDLHGENVLRGPADWRIIDWQKACSGNPLGDVVRTVVVIRYGDLGPAFQGVPTWLRVQAADWYALCYAPKLHLWRVAVEMKAWVLPMAAARLAGRPSDSEDIVRATLERLATND